MEENSLLKSDDSDIENEDISIIAKIDRPFNPEDINITSKQLILEAIFNRLKNNEINLFTDFQRKGDLWDNVKQSRLIESILLRFPLPAFYFDGTDDNRWQVVDGLQRISTFNNFVINKKTKLENLEFLTQFNDCSFDNLPRILQRRINEAEITIYIINEGTPSEVKFNIFKRINTGGLTLEPQEIRHALNQGISSTFIAKLANFDSFKKATNYSIKTDRMLDRDFVNRFIAFYLNDFSTYKPKPDLDSFLSNAMSSLKHMDRELLEGIEKDFEKAMQYSYKIFGQFAFRKRYAMKEDRRKPLNKALFEVWSVLFSKLSVEELEKLYINRSFLNQNLIDLMIKNDRFFSSITSGTGDTTSVNIRFSTIINLIDKVLKL